MTGQPQDLRGLKAAVAIMSVLIVIGTTIVVGTIIHRLYAKYAAPANPTAEMLAPVAGAPATTASLLPGDHIQTIAAAGPDVAVWVNGPTGERILLIDPASGTVRVGLQSAH